MLAKELAKACPFWSEAEQRYKCKWRMMHDLVLIWQPNISETTPGGIYLPEEVREDNRPKIGVVLSVGPGYWDKYKFNPTFLQKGMVVVIDVRTPGFHGGKEWRIDAEDIHGKTHSLPYMGEQDIRVLIEPEQEIDDIGSLLSSGSYRSGVLEI